MAANPVWVGPSTLRFLHIHGPGWLLAFVSKRALPPAALPQRRGSETAFGAWDRPWQPDSGQKHRPAYAVIASFINVSEQAEAMFYTSECHQLNAIDCLMLKVLNFGRIARGGEIGPGECQIAASATTLGRGRVWSASTPRCSVVATCSPERWYSYARFALATSRPKTRPEIDRVVIACVSRCYWSARPRLLLLMGRKWGRSLFFIPTQHWDQATERASMLARPQSR